MEESQDFGSRDGRSRKPVPRVMITAPSSGSGKTLLTCGLLTLLAQKGYRAVAFKEGPDYIDPMFHTRVLGVPSRNLDPFFGDYSLNRSLMARQTQGADIAVVEGAMGYYDGIGGTSTRASSYDLALQLGIPSILVAPCKGAGTSVAALVKGFAGFRSPSLLKGVVLNRLAPSRFPQMKRLIEEETGLSVLGYLPPLEGVGFKNRHLGLCRPEEVAGLQAQMQRLAYAMEETMDLEGILGLAAEAEAWEEPTAPWAGLQAVSGGQSDVVVAVARDEAFCFGYEDNWDVLRELGANLSFFSPMREETLPEGADGLWLPGGYPELHAEALGDNGPMRRCIREAVVGGMPTVAECGGFLYLHASLEPEEGRAAPMAGVFPGTARPGGRLQNFGYIHLKARQDTLLLRKGEDIPSHEFHYWRSSDDGDACLAVKASQAGSWPCVRGDGPKTLFAGFPHLYLPTFPEMGRRYLDACRRYGKERKKALR